MKILFWDRNGFVLYLKGLEQGRFQFPVVNERRQHVEVEAAQLAMLAASTSTQNDFVPGRHRSKTGSTGIPDRDL